MGHDPEFEQVDIRVGGDEPTVTVDREQMRIVFQNLLINAAQATDGPGRVNVDVAVDAADDLCRVTVTDEGRGLTPEVAERLFEPFFTTKHRGSGLGLPTARHIVEAHRGHPYDSQSARAASPDVLVALDTGRHELDIGRRRCGENSQRAAPATAKFSPPAPHSSVPDNME